MPNNHEKGFFISDQQAYYAYNGMRIGSGVGSGQERVLRTSLKSHLGCDHRESTSSEAVVAGLMLIGYITVSTRLIGVLNGLDQEVIQKQVLENLQFDPKETPQQTFERLLEIAQKNGESIDPIKKVY